MALLTLFESNSFLVPTDRQTWPRHLITQDVFWKRAEKDLVEAQAPFEFVDSESTGGETWPIMFTKLYS